MRISRRALRITPRTRWALWPRRLISRASRSPVSLVARTAPAGDRRGPARRPRLARRGSEANGRAPVDDDLTRRTKRSPSASRSTTSATPTGGGAPSSNRYLRIDGAPSASGTRGSRSRGFLFRRRGFGLGCADLRLRGRFRLGGGLLGRFAARRRLWRSPRASAVFLPPPWPSRSASSDTACSSVRSIGIGALGHVGVDGLVLDVGTVASGQDAHRLAGYRVRAQFLQRGRGAGAPPGRRPSSRPARPRRG